MLTCIGQARDLLLRSIGTHAYAGGGTWISSPTAAIATASRRYIWSRIVCPGPQLRELHTHSGAYSSLRATLTGA